ncbi:extracellular solute-binding protein [Variovorax sp. LT1R16]|uniref:extracellular solute-binding protein n=1 Tax=Variovorax sp. LT1R16 TaxID=3443728 RepID=UPI003F44E10A
MTQPAYRGLTWDHPRGYVALERAAQRARTDGLDLTWERQPLEGFESHPIEALAERYDLIVLDHPHIGDAVAGDCLQPLASLFDAATLAGWRAQSIGRSFDSYRYAGTQWALPLDAATQVAVAREDRLEGALPRDWTEVLALAARQPVCLSLAGPHAALTLFSMAAAHGDAPAAHDPGRLFAGEGAVAAWELLTALHALSFRGWAGLNPIGILDAMARDPEAVYCPLVYGYVNYAVAGEGRQPLRFGDVPAGPEGRLGSTLGGTGLAVSRRATVDDTLRQHLAQLMSPAMQCDFIPFADGQPSARAAWSDPRVDAAWNGFYAQTQATLEQAIVRPRHPGYIPFQTEASALVRGALADRLAAAPALAALQALYARCRPAGSEV